MKLTGFCSSFAILPLLFSHTLAAPQTHEKREDPTTPKKITPDQIDFEYFSKLPAYKTLEWVSCYGGYHCARLEVPLNYDKPEDEKVKLALVKLSAQPSAKYKGILYLQIGPGNSATNLVLEFGLDFQRPTLEGYDIIGWDVRGVGQTTPLLRCFEDEAARVAYLVSAPKVLGDPSVSLDEGIKQNLEYAKKFGQACKHLSGAYLPYFDTPNNARDLHTIMEATGSKKVTAFWGYQYASLLGETFGALYPNEFDHLILDGVVQGEKQYGFGDIKTDAIRDAEKAFQVFFDSCAAAGKDGCAFWEQTPDLIRKRYQKVETQLIAHPIPVPGFPSFDYSQLHTLIAGVVTNFDGLFVFLASLLAEAETGVAGENIYGFFSFPLSPLPSPSTDGSFEYSTAIFCLDQDPYTINSPEDFKPYLKSVLRKSPAIGHNVALEKLFCAGSSFSSFPRQVRTERKIMLIIS